MEFSRQEYWSGLSFPSSGDLPDPGIKPMSLTSPALAGGFFTTSATWELPLLVGLQSGTPILIARCLLFTCILEMSPCLPPCESYPALSPCTGSNTVFFWFFSPHSFLMDCGPVKHWTDLLDANVLFVYSNFSKIPATHAAFLCPECPQRTAV